MLGTAAMAGPALLTAGAIAPAAASEAVGGGIPGAMAGGAVGGAGTSLLTQPTQGQNPFSGQGLKEAGESAVVGGLMGGVMGAGGKVAGRFSLHSQMPKKIFVFRVSRMPVRDFKKSIPL